MPATPTQDDAGFRKLNRDAPLRAGQPAEVPSGEPATFLCREAILGRNQRTAGYQFMLQEGARARIRHSTRRVHHLYAEVLVRSLASADIGELLGHRVAFIDVPDSVLARMFGASFVRHEVEERFLEIAKEMLERHARIVPAGKPSAVPGN